MKEILKCFKQLMKDLLWEHLQLPVCHLLDQCKFCCCKPGQQVPTPHLYYTTRSPLYRVHLAKLPKNWIYYLHFFEYKTSINPATVFSTKLFTSSWSYRFKEFVYVSCHMRILTLYMYSPVGASSAGIMYLMLTARWCLLAYIRTRQYIIVRSFCRLCHI